MAQLRNGIKKQLVPGDYQYYKITGVNKLLVPNATKFGKLDTNRSIFAGIGDGESSNARVCFGQQSGQRLQEVARGVVQAQVRAVEVLQLRMLGLEVEINGVFHLVVF